jgi:hypothetical protein
MSTQHFYVNVKYLDQSIIIMRFFQSYYQWECPNNFWDPENATCDAPQDSYDPDRESTLNYNASEPSGVDIYEVGTYRDVFCNKNLIFYEAMVVRHKTPKKGKDIDKVFILFHFKGWSSKFDEWIEAGSDRIKMHNLHTDPTSSDPRDQEKWQGKSHI